MTAASRGAGTKQRRPLWMYLVAVGLTLAIIWGIVAVAFSSSQDGADRQQTNPGPADTLKDRPQTDHLGGDSGGGE